MASPASQSTSDSTSDACFIPAAMCMCTVQPHMYTWLQTGASKLLTQWHRHTQHSSKDVKESSSDAGAVPIVGLWQAAPQLRLLPPAAMPAGRAGAAPAAGVPAGLPTLLRLFCVLLWQQAAPRCPADVGVWHAAHPPAQRRQIAVCQLHRGTRSGNGQAGNREIEGGQQQQARQASTSTGHFLQRTHCPSTGCPGCDRRPASSLTSATSYHIPSTGAPLGSCCSTTCREAATGSHTPRAHSDSSCPGPQPATGGGRDGQAGSRAAA